jgi:hypothetical protein
MAKRYLAALACALFVAGCSSPSPDSAEAPPVDGGTPSTVDPGADVTHHVHPAHGNGDGRRDGHDASNDASTNDDNDQDASSRDGSSGDSSDGGGQDSLTAPYPRAGDSVYSQKGTEAFCDPAGNCEQDDLPPTQTVSTSLRQRRAAEGVVVQEARMSDGRYVRTTLHFTPKAAFVTDVYYKLVYQGFDITEEYAPDPPVPSIRFPLAAGKSWTAEWSADTSGDYRARVTGAETIPVGGTSVRAYRIETLAHFRGEYRGKASVVIWVDPATRAIVQTNGAMELKASYGGYNTTFETRLKSAPGY